jgi:hypothetical protein
MREGTSMNGPKTAKAKVSDPLKVVVTSSELKMYI